MFASDGYPAASSTASGLPDQRPITVSYLTEQTSHHPPVSAFIVECPGKGITARGFDQISAKFTGTSVRVTPGTHNRGIFITLHNRGDEEYQLTHPAAQLGGLLRGAGFSLGSPSPLPARVVDFWLGSGSLSVSVSDTCYVLCPKTRIKVILHYVEEGWLGRAQNKVQGVIFRYDPDHDTTMKIKDVLDPDILATVDGCWQEKVYFTVTGKPVRTMIS